MPKRVMTQEYKLYINEGQIPINKDFK